MLFLLACPPGYIPSMAAQTLLMNTRLYSKFLLVCCSQGPKQQRLSSSLTHPCRVSSG